MLIDSGDEVFEGVVYTLGGRFGVHFDLGLGGDDSEVHHSIRSST
jgi:hypothetical protein